MSEINFNSLRTGPDSNGKFGIHGGRFVAETLMPLILEVETSYEQAIKDELFINEFGEKYLDENKEINRELLRRDIFNDPVTKLKLENIIHPLVRSGIKAFINTSKSDYCIIVVPLIYETGSSKLYDRILVIDCDVDIQIERTFKRDNQNKSEIENIINKQATREERMSIADEVILNNGSTEHLKNSILNIHKKYMEILKNG